MTGEQPIAWHLGNAPKQSITEVLQDPRGTTLDLPELASFDLSATSLALSPAPPTTLPEPLNINHFEHYLRRFAPLHAHFLAEKRLLDHAPSPPSHHLSSIPPIYFHPSFSVSDNHQLADLQPPTATPPQPLSSRDVAALRASLAHYRVTLERALRARLSEHAPAIAAALATARDLRARLHAAALAARAARESSARLVPPVADGLASVRALAAAQANVRALRAAAERVHLVRRAPADVDTLLRAGEYDAAIAAVAAAKDALAHVDLAPVLALAPVRARLAMAVEAIDGALREEFRGGLRGEGERREEVLAEVVRLVAAMGRLPLLRGFFLKEIKTELAKELKDVGSLEEAARAVKASAERALTLITIIAAQGQVGGEGESRPDSRPFLREVHDDLDKMLAGTVDRFLASFEVTSELSSQKPTYVLISDVHTLTEESCFDEFKGALKFGEQVRSLEEIASELETMLSSERRSSALRGKISERQFAFLKAFHKAHVDALTATVRADKWQEFRTPRGAVKLLNAVIENTASGPSEGEHGNSMMSLRSDGEERRALEEGTVTIGSDSFKTVISGVRYLRSICIYTLLAEKSPSISSEVARRGTELSRLFNSLVGKAVLGASALQWSGLKSITARHLSLASRTIAMAAALAERVNKTLAKALSGSHVGVVLPLIQKSEKDLRDHHAQLLAKILAIMIDRLRDHEEVLQSYPWNKAQEMERFEMPSPYMTKLVKEATVLHRILWAILPMTEVQDIFRQVCAAYGSHLSESYGSLDGGKRWVRTRVSKDVTCLHDTLVSLDVFKANPSALKPVIKLHSRFAKELQENNDTGNGEAQTDRALAKRSFIRSQNDSHAMLDPKLIEVARSHEMPRSVEKLTSTEKELAKISPLKEALPAPSADGARDLDQNSPNSGRTGEVVEVAPAEHAPASGSSSVPDERGSSARETAPISALSNSKLPPLSHDRPVEASSLREDVADVENVQEGGDIANKLEEECTNCEGKAEDAGGQMSNSMPNSDMNGDSPFESQRGRDDDQISNSGLSQQIVRPETANGDIDNTQSAGAAKPPEAMPVECPEGDLLGLRSETVESNPH